MKIKLFKFAIMLIAVTCSRSLYAAFDPNCEVFSDGHNYYYPQTGIRVQDTGAIHNLTRMGDSYRANLSKCVRYADKHPTDKLDEISSSITLLSNKIGESDENYKKQIEILSAKVVSLQTLQAEMLQLRVSAIEQALRGSDEPDNARLNAEIIKLKEMIEKLISINSKYMQR